MVYRFRDCKTMLKYRELEEGYFFFASPEEQNDPMEGYIDYYWNGDEVAWLGLFKNYVWQLYNAITFYIPMSGWVHPEDGEKYIKQLYLARTEIGMKNMPLIDTRAEIEKGFAADEYIRGLASSLGQSNKDISERELIYTLSSIHIRALRFMSSFLKKTSMAKYYVWLEDICCNIPESADVPLEKWIAVFERAKEFQAIADVSNNFNRTMGLIARLRKAENVDRSNGKILFLLLGFAENYVKEITGLSYAAGYSVSFTKYDSNPAMWGYYADGHKGVALIFDYEDGDIVKLKCLDDTIAKQESNQEFKLEKIEYVDKFHRENFFHTLGNLWGDERKHWFTDGEQRSSTISWVMENSEKWRDDYIFWQKNRLLRKNSSSKGENEYRIIIDDYWISHKKNPPYRAKNDESKEKDEVNNRQKYRYEFGKLRGIVFGLNTRVEDKLRIIEVINEKCKETGRKHFDFYQAVFDCHTNEIKEERILFS